MKRSLILLVLAPALACGGPPGRTPHEVVLRSSAQDASQPDVSSLQTDAGSVDPTPHDGGGAGADAATAIDPAADASVPDASAADAAVPWRPVLVRGLELTAVTINQGVEIPLMQDGLTVAERNAPIVRGRPALIRIFARPASAWQPRSVVARFESSAGSVESRQLVAEASMPANTTSTFNFQLTGAEVTANFEWSISLFEGVVGSYPGTDQASRFPAVGREQLLASDVGGALDVVIVPIRYLADGSGRLPDTSAAKLDVLRDVMLGLYPVPEVNITVRAPVDFTERIEAYGQGWQSLLQAVLTQRTRDAPPRDVYYYGLVDPAPTPEQYCARGCVGGISNIGTAMSNYARGSVGVGYDGPLSTVSFVHELGHAHGRAHAPCGLGGQASDPSYPYPGALTGVWGFERGSSRLLSPTTHKDMMGYCEPRWISDYTYSALFDRIAFVNADAQIVGDRPRRWVSIVIDSFTGVASWGATISTLAPAGRATSVSLLGTDGGSLGSVVGHRFDSEHGGAHVLIPPLAAQVVAIRLDDGTVLPR